MNKLELKHIQPYLLHNVKFISELDKPFDELGYQPIWTIDGINKMFGGYCFTTKENNDAYPIENCKLLLTPFNELLEETNDDLYLELCEILGVLSCENLINSISENTMYSMDYRKFLNVSEFLDSNHFDWRYGLINNGLAINKSKKINFTL